MVGGSVCGPPDPTAGRRGGDGHAGRVIGTFRRPRRALVLGGARSGKSSFAEQLLARERAVDYVACGLVPDGSDPEWTDRVALHRSRRPASWRTIETLDLPAVLGRPGPPVLIDCLTTWLARVMDDCGVWSEAPDADARLAAEVDALLDAWRATRRRVVAVSNEVGSGVVPATPSGRRFRDELGVLNTRVAAASPPGLAGHRRPAPAAALSAAQAVRGPSQRSIPASTACWSIAASSSSAKSRLSSAPMFCSSWPTLLAPMRTVVTRGSRSAQASASCARLCPRCCGDVVQRADVRRAPPR